MRGPSGRGASRLARADVLEQYVEHGKQAQRSHGGRIVCFGRRVVRNAGYGSSVAAVIFFAGWGALTMWFLQWGFFLGWIPAAVMATCIGYRCR